MDIRLRVVERQDHLSTRETVHAAFQPEDVVTFLDALRADGCVLDEWLAEDASGTVGHIAFSRAYVEQETSTRLHAAFLTPLAVRPDRQRRGIGGMLMDHALRTLEGRGENLFFVIGHPTYYPRAGFRSVSAESIESPWSGNPAFMVRSAFTPVGRLVLPSVIADAH